MKTYRQNNITVEAETLEQAEYLMSIELDKIGLINEPINLEDITHNNGWIKINSEDDLPKDFLEQCYHTFPTDYQFNSDGLHTYFKQKEITHYQPITKPLPPLY